MVLEVILVVLGVVLVVLHGAQRQCSEQMFGTDSVRNNVPCQLSPGLVKQTLLDLQDHQNHLQDHQNHPQEHQNHLQDHQNQTHKQPPKGGWLFGGF